MAPAAVSGRMHGREGRYDLSACGEMRGIEGRTAKVMRAEKICRHASKE